MKLRVLALCCFLIPDSLFAQPKATELTSVDVNRAEIIFTFLQKLEEKFPEGEGALNFIRFLGFIQNFGGFAPPRPVFPTPHDTVPHDAVSQQPVPVVGPVMLSYSVVYPAVAPYVNYFPVGASGGQTTVQPVSPPDPRVVFLDGLGDSIVELDQATLAVLSHVVVPSTAGPLGLRPNATGPVNEAWVANGGLEVSIVDLGAQSLVTNILTPSVPQASVPAGIVFTPDGATAFEAIRYFSADSSGNNGALLVFDAVNRKVSSTLPLNVAPAALLMAPDGSTAYLLSTSGQLTYYDILSSTADLTVSTYPPGQNTGYPGTGTSVFIHPDGERMLWNVGVNLIVFDIPTRQVLGQFPTGLPTTTTPIFSLSQDGGRAYFSDPLGDVVIMDTQYGEILGTYNAGGAATVFGGPPIAP